MWDNLGLLEAKENATDKDEDTGVNYVVVSRYSNLKGTNSVAICPRYNADGTLYTGE